MRPLQYAAAVRSPRSNRRASAAVRLCGPSEFFVLRRLRKDLLGRDPSRAGARNARADWSRRGADSRRPCFCVTTEIVDLQQAARIRFPLARYSSPNRPHDNKRQRVMAEKNREKTEEL